MLEADAIGWIRAACDRAARRDDRGLQILIERREIKVVLVHAANGREYGADRALALTKQAQIHRHVTQADRAAHRGKGNPDVRAVQGQRAEQPKPEAPAVAPDRERPIFPIQPDKDIPIASQQSRSETKE